jgi:eukaryotic-like serine/threonine-protein kinase
LSARYGSIAEAEVQLRDAFEKQRALAGDSAAVASAMGYYGSVLTVRGRYEDAISTLRTSVKIAVQFTGASSPLSVLNRVFLAEALMAAGQNEAASQALDENLALGIPKLGAENLFVSRTRVAQARLHVANGSPERADAELAALIEPLRKVGITGRPMLALALVARGEALLAQHKSGDAVPLLLEATKLREQLLWDQSWELAEARGLLGEALGASEGRGRQLLAQSLAVLEAQLGAQHPLTQRVRAALPRGL